MKIEAMEDSVIRAMIDEKLVKARVTRLTPDRPTIRGTAQNPDVYFKVVKRSILLQCAS